MLNLAKIGAYKLGMVSSKGMGTYQPYQELHNGEFSLSIFELDL